MNLNTMRLMEKSYRSSDALYMYRIPAQAGKRTIRMHWHEEVEMICCRCTGMAYIDNVPEPFGVGDIIFVNSNQLHQIDAEESGDLVCLVFNYRMLDFKAEDWCQQNILNRLKENSLAFPTIVRRETEAYDDLFQAVEEIMEVCGQEACGYQLGVKCGLYRLLYHLYCKGMFVSRAAQHPRSDVAQIQYVKKIISYIEAHYAHQITLDEIAKHANISKGYALHLFHDIAGDTPIAYLQNLRLEKAEELLKNGHSVTDAALECGFNNVSYFIRVFKRKYGVTPKKIAG